MNNLFRIDTHRVGWRLILLIAGISITATSSSAWSQELVHGDQMKSINQYCMNDFSTINVITKSWDDTYDARRRFHFSFYGYYGEPSAYRNYMQDIKVYDDSHPIDIYDWDTPGDCSIEKMMIIKDKHSDVYLIIADRAEPETSNIIPSDVAEPQRIRVFKLTHNEGGKESIGRPLSYFYQVAEVTSDEKACAAKDVYKIMDNFMSKSIESTNK